jgi:hypothetical protein
MKSRTQGIASAGDHDRSENEGESKSGRQGSAANPEPDLAARIFEEKSVRRVRVRL